MVCGGNEENFHFINVDLKVIENIKYFDLIAVKEEDTCLLWWKTIIYKRNRSWTYFFSWEINTQKL